MLMHGKHLRSLLLHKSIVKVYFRAVFRCVSLALFCFYFLHRRAQMVVMDILVPGPSDIIGNSCSKKWRKTGVVVEFTKCSGCFTIDNGIFFFQNFSSFGLAVKLTVSPSVHLDFYSGDRHRYDAHEYQCPENVLLKLCINASRSRELPD